MPPQNYKVYTIEHAKFLVIVWETIQHTYLSGIRRIRENNYNSK